MTKSWNELSAYSLEKGDSAVTFTPTFTVFKYCVEFQGAKFVDVPLKDDFSVDVEGMQKAFTSEAKLLYLCSPNNPTANQLKPREIEALIEEFPGIVLVDEAYAEYADYSVVPLIKKYENLVVLRTFSQSFQLGRSADSATRWRIRHWPKLWTRLLHHTR